MLTFSGAEHLLMLYCRGAVFHFASARWCAVQFDNEFKGLFTLDVLQCIALWCLMQRIWLE